MTNYDLTNYDMNPDQMLEIALRAMTKAAHEYSTEWTGKWVDPTVAPEYIYTVAIGRALKKALPGCVFLEHNIHEAIGDARRAGIRGARNKTYGKLSRVDIAIMRASDGKPVFCLEVKNSEYNNKQPIIKDVERCSGMVTPDNSTLNEAAVIFLIYQLPNRGGGSISKAFGNYIAEYGEGKVVGLDRRNKLVCSPGEVRAHQYSYDNPRKYEAWEDDDCEFKWAAVAIRIQE